MDFAQCGSKIYPYCKGIQNQEIFVAKLFRTGGSNQFSDSPYDSHEYEKKFISGQKPKPLTDKLKRTFPSPINTDGIAKFLEEMSDFATESVEITNKERQIAFKIGENAFELTLVQKRKPKS